MEISMPMIWNIVVTLIVAMAWWISQMNSELKRLNILLNMTELY